MFNIYFWVELLGIPMYLSKFLAYSKYTDILVNEALTISFYGVSQKFFDCIMYFAFNFCIFWKVDIYHFSIIMLIFSNWKHLNYQTPSNFLHFYIIFRSLPNILFFQAISYISPLFWTLFSESLSHFIIMNTIHWNLSYVKSLFLLYWFTLYL